MRELYLQIAICNILKDKFEISNRKYGQTPVRARRGEVHRIVAETLGLKIDNYLCSAIRAAVVALGSTPYISTGRQYYKHLHLRDHYGNI